MLFSAVISEHFSKNRMIMSVLVAKIWYLKNVRFLLGHPVNVDVKFIYGVGHRFFSSCAKCRANISHSDRVIALN